MRDTFTIFSFELKNRLKQKTIIITTLIFVLLAFATPFIPRIVSSVKSSEDKDSINTSKTKIGYMINDENVDKNFVTTSINGFDAVEFEDLDSMKKAISNDDIESGFLFKEESSIDGYYKNQGLGVDDSSKVLMEQGESYLKSKKLEELNIGQGEYDEVSNIKLEINPISLGKNASTGFLAGYIGMFIMYMTVILFGNQVATLVAREKSDRTMEILITTTKPTGLIVGKVFATAVLALAQMLLIILAMFIGYKLNKSFYPPELLDMITASLNPKSIIVFLVYYLLGLLLYLFIFASLGALVSKVEEVANAVGPISVIIIVSFILTSSTMSKPDSTILRVISLIPFSSPIAFFTRYNLISIPVMDFVISLGLLILSIIIFAYLSIRIYRLGTLNYGNRINLFKAVKMLKDQD